MDSNQVMKGVLDEAAGLVTGDRQKAYGLPEVNHQRTAEMWSTYLGVKISPTQVCHLNALQKIARQVTAYSHDNTVDVIGFMANAAACEAAQRPPDGT